MPLIYGHRGARGEAPENTIAGFRHARDAGVDGIETDIAMTADLVPVLHHDPVLADSRLIRDVRAAALPGIPTLAETLAALPGMTWLLEIKTFPDHPDRSHPPAVMARQVLAALAESGVDLGNAAIKAFDWRVLEEVARQCPKLRRICLTAPATEAAPELWWGMARAASTPQAVAATGAYAWSAFHETLTSSQVAEAKSLGLHVLTWTVNAPTDFARLSALVDGIVTDFPSRFIGKPTV